jgi:plastocyanin
VSQLSVPTARRLARGAAALAICAAFLTACGGNNSTDTQASANSGSGSSSGGQALTATEADFRITLDKDKLTAGTYDITVVNKGHATHDLVVEKDGKDVGQSDTVAPGKSTTLTVTLASGNYVLFCNIGNHRAMGMETTVSVS